MNLSFREKSLWLDLLATLGIAIYYLFELNSLNANGTADIRDIMNLLRELVVLCIGVSIVSWVVLSAQDKKAADKPLDEREQLAELKATRYGYWLLLMGITAPILLYSLSQGNSDVFSIDLPAYATLHTMVFFFVAAEVLVSANQLWRLRRDL